MQKRTHNRIKQGNSASVKGRVTIKSLLQLLIKNKNARKAFFKIDQWVSRVIPVKQEIQYLSSKNTECRIVKD